MKPELDQSQSRFHAAIVGGAKGEETPRAIAPLSGTLNAPVEHLDLATAIKVSQALSGEIAQEKQLEILMRTALEQAGAERGVLVLSPSTEPRIAAQATAGDGGIVVKLHDEAMTPAVLPESLIQHAMRTNESVILDDAAAQNPFSADPYIRQQHARSILCLPFLNQGQLTGVLYLENNRTPGVFAPARVAVLRLLAAQAAISLENARLYRDLRAIIDSAPVFLWSDLPDGYCDFLNQPWLAYFNLSLEEARGAGWATVLHPDDVAHHLERWQRSVSTGIPFESEARFRRSDGEYRWFLTRANPLRDKTGRIVKWYGTNIDIENLKRTEERLRQNEGYLAQAQRLSHSGVAAYNETAILYGSEEIYRIWGLDPAQGVPSREAVFRQIHPDDRDRLLAEVQRAVGEKRGYSTGYRIVLPDGTTKHLEVIGQPVFSASGELVEIVTTQIDVTEQKRAALALSKSEERYARAMEASGDGHTDWNIETGELYVSPRYLEICGLPRDTTFRDRAEWVQAFPFHPEDRAKWEAAVAAHLASRGAHFREEMRIVVRGETRWLDVTYVCQRDAAGQPIRWTSSCSDITERRRAEEELRRSQHYLAEGQKLSHTASWAWSPVSNTILYWSEECYRIYGYDPAQGLPSFESTVERIHPEDRPAVLETVDKAVREKADFQTEHRLVLPGGIVRDLRILAHPVPNASGELIEYLGTVMDVTEQKRAEEERKEHLWFLECMDRVNRAMQRTNDVEGMMRGVLEETLAIFGSDRARLVYPCDPDAAEGRVVMEHTHPEYPGAFALGEGFPVDTQMAELFRHVLEGPGAPDLSIPPEIRERFGIQSILAIAVRPKGDRPYLFGLHQCSHARVWSAAERRLFEEIARRLEDALTSVLAHCNLLAREEELGRSRAYLAEAQRVSHTGSFAWNNVTREIVYWSEECFRIYGRDPAQGPPSLEQVLAGIDPADVPGIVASLEEALRDGREWKSEYRLINLADGPRTVRTIAHPVLDRSGRAVEYIGTVVDITEQKRAEQALRDAREKLAQASKITSLAELSASIAHEINQPLQAIVSAGDASLRWLDATPPNIDKARRSAERVVRDGKAAAEVVHRIRALFKRAPPAKVDLDINKLIVQVCALMADEIQRNAVSVETGLGEDVPTIGADAVQIQQVIVNLVRNAIEAMAATVERPKPLRIRSRREGDTVVLDVRDQGAGLADPEKVFEPFVTTKKTGMGMGLAICRSIIEAHEGRIWFARNEDRGTTFSFSLPIDELGGR